MRKFVETWCLARFSHVEGAPTVASLSCVQPPTSRCSTLNTLSLLEADLGVDSDATVDLASKLATLDEDSSFSNSENHWAEMGGKRHLLVSSQPDAVGVRNSW